MSFSDFSGVRRRRHFRPIPGLFFRGSGFSHLPVLAGEDAGWHHIGYR
jgi:hypothetical protein